MHRSTQACFNDPINRLLIAREGWLFCSNKFQVCQRVAPLLYFTEVKQTSFRQVSQVSGVPPGFRINPGNIHGARLFDKKLKDRLPAGESRRALTAQGWQSLAGSISRASQLHRAYTPGAHDW